MRLDALIAEARALQLSDRAIEAVILSPDPERTLGEAKQVIDLCAFAQRPELVEEHVGQPLKALHARLVNDRAELDVHIDTSPRVELTIYESREAR